MSATTDRIGIAGVGIHPFGRHPGVTAGEMGVAAINSALADAGVKWTDVDYAVGGSMMSGNPDSLVAQLGLTGLTFQNVRNACATGGSTLLSAANALRSTAGELAVVVGYDKHDRGAFNLDPSEMDLGDWYGEQGLMLTPQFFAMKARRYMHEHGISDSALAKVAAKAYRNASKNPNAFRREPMTEQQIADSRMLVPPMTQYMFCSPNEGAAAAVLVTERKADELGVEPIWLRGVGLRTRSYGSFDVFGPSVPLEEAESPAVGAARDAFAMAAIDPKEVDVAQLQDGESGAEIYHMGECGLCEHGEQEQLIAAGETEIDGKLPVNTDGGLIANGEPVGASGLRQVHEIVLQLRGDAGERQVPGDPRVGFTQVYGAPGVSACTVLARA